MTLLRRLVDQRRLTREETRRLLLRRARELGIDNFTLELRQLDRWLRGHLKGLPHPAACRVLEAEFNHPVERLLEPDGPPPPDSSSPEVAQLITTAAQRSASWGRWADSLGVGELALEGLRLRLAKLASDYVHSPMVPVVRELITLRDDLFEVLAQPDPSQARELYFLAGATCGIIAHASGNLGYSTAALDQAQTAMICARKAEHPLLAAWVTGVRALQREWGGQPAESLNLLARASVHTSQVTVLGTTSVWLCAIRARAYARLGDRAAAAEAVDRVHRARERAADQCDDLDRMGGIFTFDVAKQSYYLATTHRRLGQTTDAAHHASTAIDTYERAPAPERSYGDEALAGIELSIARTVAPRPDLDGAAAALRPITERPAARIAAMSGPLQDLLTALSQPRLRTSVVGGRMREEIRQLLPECRWQTTS